MLKNKLQWIFLLLSAAVLSVLYNSYVLGLLFVMPLILGISFFILNFIQSYLAHFTLKPCVRNVTCHDSFHVSLEFSNRSLFPIGHFKADITFKNMLNGSSTSSTIEIPLNARSTKQVDIVYTPDYPGLTNIEVSSLSIYDYFKLWKKKIPVSNCASTERVTIVLPNASIFEEHRTISTTSFLSDSNMYSPYKPGDDISELFDVRDYRPGDNLNRIHRKLSEKTGKMIIKEFSDPLDSASVIILDLRGVFEGTEPSVKRFLDSFYSMAIHLVNNNLPFEIIWYDARHTLSIHKITTYESLVHIMPELYVAIMQDNPLDVIELASTFSNLADFGNIFIFSAAYSFTLPSVESYCLPTLPIQVFCVLSDSESNLMPVREFEKKYTLIKLM